jgi:hypothetical protein
MSDTDARLWHPWLDINRVLRVMLRTHIEHGGAVPCQGRVQAGARVAERDPARGLIQLAEQETATSDRAARSGAMELQAGDLLADASS